MREIATSQYDFAALTMPLVGTSTFRSSSSCEKREEGHPRIPLVDQLRMRLGLAAALAAVVGSLSAATVGVDPDCDMMGSVTWTEKVLANGTSRLTLKATAKDGYTFAEWSVKEEDIVAWPDDPRYPGTLTATVSSNAAVMASFVTCADDCLSLDISGDFPEEMSCDEDVSVTLSVDSLSYPTISFLNLPPGLSFDNRTLTVFGKPNAPGLYRVEANAVNESGFTFRSFCTVRVLNVDSARVMGIDTAIPVDQYIYFEIGADDPSDLFSFSETPTAVTLTGTVPGLTWNGGWQLLYGTPTEPGEYTLEISASFSTGAVERATMTLMVTGDDPEDFGLSFDVMEDLRVGDELDETCEIGADSPDSAIRSVDGLPTGLTATSRYESGALRWFVSGTVSEPGVFVVTAQVEDRSGETQRLAKVVRTVTVGDVPDVYLPVSSSNTARGMVSGGGAVAPYRDVTLVATPRPGNIFAGWHDSDGERLVLVDGVDYRTPSVVLPAGTGFAFLAPVAHFAPAVDDAAPDLSELEEAEFSFAPDESFQFEFVVDSLSLPTLSFRGLPKGMTFSADGTGGYVLSYDPWTSVAASGRYTVTATAVNASARKSTATFRITVETRSDARIHVYDDYGEFTPGEEIDPINFSDAVDYAHGETFTVSGLPRGLVYNAKANEKKGIAANTVTGTPTVPGDYTLTFTAKVISGTTTNRTGKVTTAYETVKVTAFLTVLPYPALEIDVDEDAAAVGCKVTGAGTYKAGTKVTLQAKAAKGWVFAGWEGLDEVDGLAALNPKLSYVTGSDDVWAQAYFMPVSEDALTVYAPDLTSAGFAAEWVLKEELDDGDAMLIAELIESASWPTVKVDGLPSGVKFSTSTFRLSGKPSKSGVSHVTVTAKNAGGYSFVRVFDVAVLEVDGSLPSEKALENAAGINFSPLMGLMTGSHCPTGEVVLAVGKRPGTGSAVKKVAVSGLPPGLSAAVAIVDGEAAVEVTGTPTKPGRVLVSVSVTYEDGKTLKSQAAIVVADGGSRYLYVTSDDEGCGTVSGEGVYAAGATVKLIAKAKAKHIFAGWHVADGEGDLSLFTPLRDLDGIDPRTATVSFLFRPADFSGAFELSGRFVASGKDISPTILLEQDVWEIGPSDPSAFSFAVQSLSAPNVTVSGLPKGVTVDAVRGLFFYAPTVSAQPGIYTATLSAKNATVLKASETSFEIHVANRTSDVIGGLNSDMDAYPLTVGVTIDPKMIVPEVADGWTLSVKGLPSGLSFKKGLITGVPSKAGTFTVTMTATSGTGKQKRTEIATVTVRVAAVPSTIVGSYAGLVRNEADEPVGSLTMTLTAAGKTSLSFKLATGSPKFNVAAFDSVDDKGCYAATGTVKGGSVAFQVDSAADWAQDQVEGSLTYGGQTLLFSAQRNAFGAKDGEAEAIAALKPLVGTWNLSNGLQAKIAQTGSVRLTGKIGSINLSESSTVMYNDGFYFVILKFLKNKLIRVTAVFDEKMSVWSCRTEEIL